MQPLRFDKPQARKPNPKIMQYALNPPCSSIEHTHYATVLNDTMRYLLQNGDWFVFTSLWQYIQHVPHCTPVGEIEVPREQVETAEPVTPVHKTTEFPIYDNRKWKGD